MPPVQSIGYAAAYPAYPLNPPLARCQIWPKKCVSGLLEREDVFTRQTKVFVTTDQ